VWLLLQNGINIQPAQNVFVEYRSFAVIVIGFDVEPNQDYYHDSSSNTAPEDYLDAPETDSIQTLLFSTGTGGTAGT